PVEAAPEAWALPNADYEDEETENPPGHRIKASAVTGHDGQILVGEEPSKVPFIVLGVAALFAVALIVIALVMLLRPPDCSDHPERTAWTPPIC
ncbi:hypothetical protein DN540_40785, partial [Burkholderia multivorans]